MKTFICSIICFLGLGTGCVATIQPADPVAVATTRTVVVRTHDVRPEVTTTRIKHSRIRSRPRNPRTYIRHEAGQRGRPTQAKQTIRIRPR